MEFEYSHNPRAVFLPKQGNYRIENSRRWANICTNQKHKSMKARISFLTMLLFATSLTFTSCSDSDDEEDAPAPSSTPAPDGIPVIPMADAALIAVESFSITDTPLGPIESNVGTGVAVFYDANNNFVTAGDVSLNETALTLNDNNTYTLIPSLDAIFGVDFSTGVNWLVEGGKGFSTLDHSVNFGFPDVGELSVESTVDRSQDYTIQVNSVSGADSIIYMVNEVMKTVAGNQNTCTFTSDELSALSGGTGIVQAAAYKMQGQEFSGKSVYFVNESVVSQTVTIE